MAVVNKIMKTFNVQNGSDTIQYEIFDAAGRRSIAPDWYENSTSAFSVGNFVMKDGVLYQFISPHAANTPWDASEVEAASIASSMSGKADKVDNATSGNFAGLDSNGNLTDSGHKHSDYLTEHQDISGKLNVSEKGAANGVAELDSNGKVPSSQLPSYVDDVVEGYYYDGKFYREASHTTEIPAEDGKIYIDIEENKTYRWSGSIYVAIGGDLTLGETSSTAYRGDRGNAAYDHASDPNKISAQQTSGFYKVAVTAEGHIQSVSAVQKSDITDLGIPGSHQDISGKADKDTDAVTGNFAEFDANGNPVDSGHKHSDYASQQDLSGKINATEKGVANGVATLGADGKVPSTQLPAGQTTISKIEMNGQEVPISSAGVADLGTVITQHQDISGKADKVSNATNGNFAGLNSAGNLTDSGVGASDFLPVDQGSTNAGKFMRVGNTGAVSYDSPTERYASTSQFPATGDSGKLYIAEDTGMIYVWETNDYSSVGGSDIPDFTGATSSTAGSHGLVPAPTTSDRNKFLKGDGTWGEAGTGNVYGDTIDMSSSDSTKVATAIGNKLDANQGSANAGKFMKVGNDGSLVPEEVNMSGKADKVSNATSGNFAGLDANGNLTDSGSKASDFLTQHQDITGKADKVSGATTGNFAGLDANGNLTDSGSKASDFLTQHQDISGKADKVSNATSGNFAGLDANGNLTDSGHKHSDYLTQHQDISGKADKVSGATSGNFAGLDANGNLTDSGSKASDFLTQHQDISGKVDKNQGVAYAGKALGINNQGMVEPVEFSGTDFTGATGTTAGTHGLVPAPAAGDNTKYLMGDGTWEVAPGARIVQVTTTVTNTSGSYTNTIQDARISADMKAISLEIANPYVFNDKITVTCNAGSVTFSCNDVTGTSVVKINIIKADTNATVITSEEFDILDAAKVDKDQGIANAGKALGINAQGMVEPVPFSGEDFTGATSSTAGTHGYVPAPAAGDQDKVLTGGGTWVTPVGSRVLVVDLDDVTNTSGSYTHTTTVTGMTSDLKAVAIECSDPTIFKGKVTVTTGTNSVTLTCSDVAGSSTVKVSFLAIGNANPLSSTEYGALDTRIGQLNDLDTTDKSSVVDAVNEVNNKISYLDNVVTGTPVDISSYTSVANCYVCPSDGYARIAGNGHWLKIVNYANSAEWFLESSGSNATSVYCKKGTKLVANGSSAKFFPLVST